MMIGGSGGISTFGALGAEGEAPFDPVKNRKRWYGIFGSTISVVGFAIGVTLLNIGMRHVEKTAGGFCASGGPYVIANQCGATETKQIFIGIGAMLVFGGAFAGLTAWAEGPGLTPSGLMWAALFISLGIQFILVGQGTGLFVGIMFIAMGAVGLYPPISDGWAWLKRGGEPEVAPLAFGGKQIVHANIPTPAPTAATASTYVETPPPAKKGPVIPSRLVIPPKDIP
jgi:hypothetical protein